MSEKKILVIDDDPVVVAGIQAILDLHDLQSEGAWDCDGAEALIGTEFFPVILSDLRMHSEDDGLRIIDAVKRLSPRSRVATITGYADPATEARLKERGAHMILRKPLLDDELMSAVRELLAVVEAEAPNHEDDDSLYAATIDRLRAIARGRYGFSLDEAEELVQETWLLYLEKRNGVLNQKAWLSGTIANLCRQEIDRRVRARDHCVDVRPQSVHPADDTILAVRQALAGVDERSRTLCTLIGMEQLSYEEVSAAAGIPVGSVGPLYIRAKARLRRAFA